MEIDRVQLRQQVQMNLNLSSEEMAKRRLNKEEISLEYKPFDPTERFDRFDQEIYKQNPGMDPRPKVVIEEYLRPKVGETIDPSVFNKLFQKGDPRVYYVYRDPSRFSEESIGTDLFDQPDTFFQDLANKYLESPTYLMSINECENGIGKYASDVLNFFGKNEGDNHKTLVEQIKYAVKELAEKSKQRQDVGLKDLTTKLSVGDVEFSVDEMIKTINALHEIEKPLNYHGGSVGLDRSIGFGMSVSQIKRYAVENLNIEQGKLLTDAYQQRVERAIEIGDSYAPSIEEKFAQAGKSMADFHGDAFASLWTKSKGTAKEAVYKLFSSLDTSSDSAYKASFAKAMVTFDSYMKRLEKSWLPTQSYYQTANNSFYGMQINSNGVKQTKPFSVYA